MTAYLLCDDALRSRELRHEIAEAVMDPITFIEHDGRRILVGTVLEEPIFAEREDVVDEFWNTKGLGSDELVDDHSFPEQLIGAELARRALERLGASAAVVPPSFPTGVADYLREHGIGVVVDDAAWAARRRRKAPWELEGIERSQRAADTAMLTAARMLKQSEETADGRLRFDGEILTAGLVREAMSAELLAQGAESEAIMVHSGDACLSGHDPGHGPILPGASCIIDCFPRDRRTGAFTDMSRTFVPGTPSAELERMHAGCRAALDLALESLRPGTSDAFTRVARFFEDQGWPTILSHDGDEPMREGFWHALGHGVGLDVHEKPWMGRRSDALVAGDVVAIEPGLYFAGVGGVRLEDTVIVTEDGAQHFTDPLSYELDL